MHLKPPSSEVEDIASASIRARAYDEGQACFAGADLPGKNVARSEPTKKPCASYRRFVYPAPNACWQLDATECVLTGGRKCVVFRLQDDHSRLAIASHVASGETSQAALAVVKKSIASHGVPQRLPTDNGAGLNPSRRGAEG